MSRPAGDRLPGLDLVERRPVGVELQDHLGEGLEHDRVEARRGAEPLVGRRGERLRVVEVAALEPGEPGGALAGRDDVDLVHERHAVPAQTGRRRPAVPRVVVEAPERDLLVAHPLGEPEGAGADELGRLEGILGALHELLRHDPEERHRVRQGAQERALRLLEGDLHGEGIDDRDGLHGAEVAPPDPDLHEAVDGRLHVLGGDRPAAVELDARPQLEGVLGPVGANAPALGELRDDPEVLADGDQALEHVRGELAQREGRVHVGVEPRQVGVGGDPQDLRGLGGRRQGGGRGRPGDGEKGQRESSEPHAFLLWGAQALTPAR